MPAGQTKRVKKEKAEAEARPAERDRSNDDVVAAIRQLGRDIANMRLWIDERAIGGIQGYAAELIGRAG